MNACGGGNPADAVDADKRHRWHVGFAGNLFIDDFCLTYCTTFATVQ